MELDKYWSSSGNHSLRWTNCCGIPATSTSSYNRIVSINALVVSSRPQHSWWTILWRKLKRERKKIFDCSSSNAVHVSNDPYTYAKNFDQGLIISDPEDSSRSFSARFAIPSRIFDTATD